MDTIHVKFKGEEKKIIPWKFSKELYGNFHNYQTSNFDADRKQADHKERFIDEKSLLRALAICEHREVRTAASLSQTQKSG